MKPKVKIENWSIGSFDSPYKAPEARSKVLSGHVTGHPTEGDATVTTSRIVEIDLAHRRVVTQNTIYVLGVPKPDYIDYALEHSSIETVESLEEGGFITREQYLQWITGPGTPAHRYGPA